MENKGQAIEKIKSFSELKNNWDGQGAFAISEIAINNAIKIIESIAKIMPDDIDPDADGRIDFWFYQNDGKSMGLFIHNDDTFTSIYYDKNYEITSFIDHFDIEAI
jgi:hypothetical protein